MITYLLIYHYDNGTRSSRIVSLTHTHTHTEHRTYFISQTAFSICACAEGQGRGPGVINLVSAFTWSTDDMRMRKRIGAGLIHAHLVGVGLIA